MKYRPGYLLEKILAMILIGLTGSLIQGCQSLPSPALQDTPYASEGLNFSLIEEAWSKVKKDYVDQAAVKPQPLTYGAISGMVDALGDSGHSRFLTPEMLQQERNLAEGKFEGIGIEVQMKNNQIVITAPMDDSPAQQAGLKPGDIILKVNQEDVSGHPLDMVVGKILGSAGTSVTLTILRPLTGRTMDFTMARTRITLHNVTWQHLPGTSVGHVRIASFSKGVTRDLRHALTDIRRESLTGIILDLRNNPGGLLEEAIKTASQFLNGGNVLLEKDSSGKVKPIPVRLGGEAPDIPMVTLINGGTASAPEIVAGALQDVRRCLLVGEKTFGTGTVLEPFSLADGSALMLAVQEWLTPAGHIIWHRGISPDIFVHLSTEISPLTPQSEKGMTAEELRASEDKPLLRALDLLSSPNAL